VKYEHGEFIYLHWEGREPYYAVKGHVSAKEFTRAAPSDWVGDPVHCYARWAMDKSVPDVDSVFYAYQKRGAGRFPVTIGVCAHGSIDFKDVVVELMKERQQ